MTDSKPPTPPDTNAGPAGNDQPNYIARSVMRLARRTERAVSPWVQRMLQAQRAETIQRSTGRPAPARSAMGGRPWLGVGRQTGLVSLAATSLVNRVQRTTEMGGVLHEVTSARTGQKMDRFAGAIIARTPPILAKYQSRPISGDSPIQRAPLPFVGGEPASSPIGVSTPAVLPGVEESIPELDLPPIVVSPDESVTVVT